jgi:DNA-binding NtrC family response regulator
VLVVDDEPGMRNFLVKTLAPRAGQVLAAASAEEAEELLRRHRFDLVILDITLPGKSGIVLLKDLREQGNPCEVVLITAFADLDTAIEALRAGASDFLLKPFRVTQVLNAFRARAGPGPPEARELGAAPLAVSSARRRPMAWSAGRSRSRACRRRCSVWRRSTAPCC